ncbi:hypothetical protein DTO96_100102 [Ephemeroptericola cinctiostellae]|uniref:Cytochrome b562 n=1 Tax=Ephemeroptericola cinctiostellae TaxID=2268024 RepID=A0A345D7R1_9BURK|nr:cytochrome b562 [Ephemeroptericola cinctiostellae]AXF84399.1 hypothetical protein DTO96_100102 [Ephemeroptericola cinctiostellae]
MGMLVFRNIFRPQIAAVALGLGALLMPAWAFADSAVEPAMKHMQHAYNQALRSMDVPQFQSALTVLHQYADVAGSLQYGRTADVRGTYQDGIRELQADLADVDAALVRNDLIAAKEILRTQVASTKKMYHKSLKVEEDD